MKFPERKEKDSIMYDAMKLVGSGIIGICDCGHGDFDHEKDHSHTPTLFGACTTCQCPAFTLQHKMSYLDFMKGLHPWIEQELQEREIKHKNIDWSKDPRNPDDTSPRREARV